MSTDSIKFWELLDMVEALKGVSQREDYHPERDAFDHSLQVFHHAMRESTDLDTILAALTHDVGKLTSPIGHEEVAVTMLTGKVGEKTLWLVQHHMRVRVLLSGEMKRPTKVKELASNKWFPDLVLLARWDTMGRNANHHVKYDRGDIIFRLQEMEGMEDGTGNS
jgi:predicted HD phosphohydrolase